MNGAAPGRETILIFCICCINCGRLYIFSRDGAGGHFKKKKTQRRTRTPLFLKKTHWLLTRGVGVFIAKQTDETTPRLFTRLTVLILTFLFTFFFFLARGRDERSIQVRNVKLSLLCPLTKVLYRLSFFKPLLCLLFICRCCRQTAWNNDTCKVARKK